MEFLDFLPTIHIYIYHHIYTILRMNDYNHHTYIYYTMQLCRQNPCFSGISVSSSRRYRLSVEHLCKIHPIYIMANVGKFGVFSDFFGIFVERASYPNSCFVIATAGQRITARVDRGGCVTTQLHSYAHIYILNLVTFCNTLQMYATVQYNLLLSIGQAIVGICNTLGCVNRLHYKFDF